MRVLLIEPDSATAASIELMLKSDGINVYTTDLGEEGIDLTRVYDYDAIISETNLPDMPGMSVLNGIRKAGIKTPLIFVSGVNDLSLQVLAINAGADDYLTKPFHKDNLLARLRAVVRRSNGHASSRLTVGGVTLDLSEKSVWVEGQHVHLTSKEYDLLELLMLRKEATISKESAMSHLYGGMDEPELKIIDVFICKVRNRLAEAGVNDLIETVWGRGYKATEVPRQPKPESWQRGEVIKPFGRRLQLLRILNEVTFSMRFGVLREKMEMNGFGRNAMQVIISNAVRDKYVQSHGSTMNRTYSITEAGRAYYLRHLDERKIPHETVSA